MLFYRTRPARRCLTISPPPGKSTKRCTFPPTYKVRPEASEGELGDQLQFSRVTAGATGRNTGRKRSQTMVRPRAARVVSLHGMGTGISLARSLSLSQASAQNLQLQFWSKRWNFSSDLSGGTILRHNTMRRSDWWKVHPIFVCHWMKFFFTVDNRVYGLPIS